MERDYIKSAASTETWQSLGDEGQTELVSRAAQRAVYRARAYGVRIDMEDILGATWTGIVDRLKPEYLTRNSGISLWRVALRAGHAAAEQMRYTDHKSCYNVPLADWNGVDTTDTVNIITARSAIAACYSGLDGKGKAVMRMLADGFTERQVGEAVGISHQAVHKRIIGIRNTIAEALA